jgi:hypothetical protein
MPEADVMRTWEMAGKLLTCSVGPLKKSGHARSLGVGAWMGWAGAMRVFATNKLAERVREAKQADKFIPESGARRRRRHKKTIPNSVVIRRLPVKRLDLIKIHAKPVGLCTWYSVVVFAKRRLSHCVGPSRGALHPGISGKTVIGIDLPARHCGKRGLVVD